VNMAMNLWVLEPQIELVLISLKNKLFLKVLQKVRCTAHSRIRDISINTEL
jgi:hypothetical protein